MNSKNEFQNTYKIIQTYKFPCILGIGAHGSVKLAINKKTFKYVAVKTISINSPSDEILIHSMFQHRNVVKLIETYIYQDKTAAILVLQYVSNGTLENMILKECLTEQQILIIFKGVCQGLNQIHRNGIIHRDIKPSNILLNENLSAKICDFGSATSQRHASKMCGTFAYLTPQMINQFNYDFKVDIWSAGVVLYEMMQNKLPFISTDKQKLLSMMKNPLKFSKPHSQKLMEITQRMLKYNPQQRIQLNKVIQQINAMITKFYKKQRRNKEDHQKQYIQNQRSQQSTKDQIQEQLNEEWKFKLELKLKQGEQKIKQKQKQFLNENQKQLVRKDQKISLNNKMETTFLKQHRNCLKNHNKISLKLLKQHQNNKQKIILNTTKSQNIIIKSGNFPQSHDKQSNKIQKTTIIKQNKHSLQNPYQISKISKKVSLKQFSSHLNK